jgi:hypothetical protein
MKIIITVFDKIAIMLLESTWRAPIFGAGVFILTEPRLMLNKSLKYGI